MKRGKFLLIMAIIFLVGGCYQYSSIITVNPDGTGTIELSLLFRKDFFGNKGIYDEEELKAAAFEYGEGVKYISSQRIEEENMSGYSTKYSFEDITRLKIDRGMATSLISDPTGMLDIDPETLQFRFVQRQDESQLTIIFPEMMDDDMQLEEMESPFFFEEEEDLEEISEVVKELYSGMKLSSKIKINGRILQTDASFREDKVITLIEVDFDKILQDEKALQYMMQMTPEGIDVLQNRADELLGIKMESKDEVKIIFR